MWKVPVTGGEPQLVAASEDARFPASFDLSHDGLWFLFGRVDQIQNDIMLLQHFR